MPEAKMKVIFLDFDGVLNSEASFRYETRQKILHVQDTLSRVACSNLQYILEQDSSIRLVISSTWRKIHTMDELKKILGSYGVDPAKVWDKTPAVFSGDRAHEINLWLEDHPEVVLAVILDDDSDVLNVTDKRCHVFQTTWEDGLLFKQAKQIAKLFRGEEAKPKVESK
jgi:HAD domain in Swiss Army Knife RNA repair proteins